MLPKFHFRFYLYSLGKELLNCSFVTSENIKLFEKFQFLSKLSELVILFLGNQICILEDYFITGLPDVMIEISHKTF